MMAVTADALRKERVIQDHLVERLVQGEGYVERDPKTDYDRPLALDKALVLRFVRQTQPEAWRKLTDQYSASAEDTFFKQLERNLKDRGTLNVLREGIKIIPGIKIDLCFFRPASAVEPKRIAEYEANVLSVMKEVVYPVRANAQGDNSKKYRIDVVLFVNGLPVATMEMKSPLTGPTYKHAEKQYRENRAPAGEPLLTFKRGALVHFAVDEDNVSMTTRLQNGKTRFLPFNRGREGGAGNPDVTDEFRFSYLYRSGEWGDAVFSRAVLIDVIGQFMHLSGEGAGQTMIFPRFQQLDAVRKAMAHARSAGPGKNYLFQHSAGSGKSNTIGWLAHHLIKLHDDQDQPVFDTAIIVTDRVVLDRQLQNTVKQFEATVGVVKKIDGTSKQLKEAIAKGARIIVTTIQKFSTEHLKEISGQGARRFAVIIDEAHSSQSGKSAQAMSEALTRDATSSEDIEEIIAAYQTARGPQPNISFFAFTATPRNVTLERFGVKDSYGKPEPFHLYSMRQAIEEGFILDVLQNYITYKAYYELEKAIADDPKLNGRTGQRRVARYASLHPTAIGQRVEIIVEHFRRHVSEMLGGHAKAMIVTSSREHALKYYFGVRDYISEQGYDDVKALIAFSGEIEHEAQVYTEAGLNGFSETELPGRFDGVRPDGSANPDQYQILIVAEKYQTGFDQPKLCAMYVDRKLAGVQAVQTLSRLNRTMDGKNKTYVLDFRNTVEEIKAAFKPYFEVTELEECAEPHLIYDLERRIMQAGYIDRDEIGRFAEIFYKSQIDARDRSKLSGIVRAAVSRFELDDDEGRRDEFRQVLKSYMRYYAFLAQIATLTDTELEKLDSYVSWLSRMLPDRDKPDGGDITDEMLRLHAFKVEEKENKNASLSKGDTKPISGITKFGANAYTEEEQMELSEIVKAFNERHGTEFAEGDIIRFEPVNDEILNEDLLDMLRNNPPDVVYSAFSQAFLQGLIRMFDKDKDMRNIVLSDADAREKVTRHFFNRAFRAARADAKATH